MRFHHPCLEVRLPPDHSAPHLPTCGGGGRGHAAEGGWAGTGKAGEGGNGGLGPGCGGREGEREWGCGEMGRGCWRALFPRVSAWGQPDASFPPYKLVPAAHLLLLSRHLVVASLTTSIQEGARREMGRRGGVMAEHPRVHRRSKRLRRRGGAGAAECGHPADPKWSSARSQTDNVALPAPGGEAEGCTHLKRDARMLRGRDGSDGGLG